MALATVNRLFERPGRVEVFLALAPTTDPLASPTGVAATDNPLRLIEYYKLFYSDGSARKALKAGVVPYANIDGEGVTVKTKAAGFDLLAGQLQPACAPDAPAAGIHHFASRVHVVSGVRAILHIFIRGCPLPLCGRATAAAVGRVGDESVKAAGRCGQARQRVQAVSAQDVARADGGCCGVRHGVLLWFEGTRWRSGVGLVALKVLIAAHLGHLMLR